MAGISVSGAGSGIDLASLLNQLISAERASPTLRFDTAEKRAESQLSALGTLKSTVASLRTAAEKLQALGAFSARTAISSDDERFTATATGSAAPGTYSVEVQALAKAHKLASGAFALTDLVGTGTLTIEVGAESFSVTIGASNTLAGIRDAINAASDNAGVRASIITADDGAHLVLTAAEGGTEHALRVTQVGTLGSLVYDPGVSEMLAVKQAAVDAIVVVDGFTHTASGNALDGVIPGVTLNLVKAEPGVTATLTVDNDRSQVKTAITEFVTAYNAVRKAIASATAYNAETRTAAALAGDTLPRSLGAALREVLGNEVGGLADGARTVLAQIGVSSSNDGSLKVDEKALDGALEADFAGVQNLFTSANGYAKKLDALLDGFLDSRGQFKTRETTLNGQLDRIADQREALERRLDALERRLKAQFAALDTMVQKMRSTGDSLTQSLARI